LCNEIFLFYKFDLAHQTHCQLSIYVANSVSILLHIRDWNFFLFEFSFQ